MVLEILHCGSCSDGRRGVTRHTDSSDEGDGVIICTFNCSNCARGERKIECADELRRGRGEAPLARLLGQIEL